MAPQSHHQLVFPFPRTPSLSRASFVAGACNAAALDLIEDWRGWPNGSLCVYGPAGSGKTHLSSIWAEDSGADYLDATHLSADQVLSQAALRAELTGCRAIIVDHADACGNEDALFHLFNIAQEEGYFALFLSLLPPSRWPVRLPDLLSRLHSLAVVELKQPDEAVLRRILEKLCRDRQLFCPPDVFDYMVLRMERSGAFARALVERVDELSLVLKRPVTKNLVGLALDDLEAAAV